MTMEKSCSSSKIYRLCDCVNEGFSLDHRLTPSRAAVHPFLASDAPLGFFLYANESHSG